MAGQALNEILRDCEILCETLGHSSPVQNGPCPYCKSLHTLNIWESGSNSHTIWQWQCINPHCRGKGTLVDALMLADHKSRREVLISLIGEEEAEKELRAEHVEAANEPSAHSATEMIPPAKQYQQRSDRLSDNDLLRIKQDGHILRDYLGVEKDSQHAVCPWCKDKCMRIGPDNKGSDIYVFQCMKSCAQGTIIDAICKMENKSVADAMKLLQERYGPGSPKQPKREATQPIRQDTSRREPVIDQEKATKFVSYAHSELVQREELHKWLKKRNISLDVAKKFRIGFFDKGAIPMLGKNGKDDFVWHVQNCWVLPITNVKGDLMAVKLHFETKQNNFDGKSIWVNFGLEPRHDRNKNIVPACSYYTLWPHLEHQADDFGPAEELGADYYLKHTPPDLREKLEIKTRENMLILCKKTATTPSDLNPGQVESCRMDAFMDMRKEIQTAVLKEEAAAKGVAYDDSMVDGFVMLMGGELKALSAISAGYKATSVTSGEGTLPESKHFECFKGKNVLILSDEDAAKKIPENGKIICAGRSFPKSLKGMILTHKPKSLSQFACGGRMPK